MPHLIRRHATYVACGLKCSTAAPLRSCPPSCHVCGMWIEIRPRAATAATAARHATYVACGLKSLCISGFPRSTCHATYVACGLKYFPGKPDSPRSASCHVCGMWIEICSYPQYSTGGGSCHVCGMWIEMKSRGLSFYFAEVMPRMWHVD